jgi:hypothetical protein
LGVIGAVSSHINAIRGWDEAGLVTTRIKMSEFVQDSMACKHEYDETFIPLIVN